MWQVWAPQTQRMVLTDTDRWDIKGCSWSPPVSPYGTQVRWYCVGGVGGYAPVERCPAAGEDIPPSRVCPVCTPHPIDILTGAKIFKSEDFSDGRSLVLGRTFVSLGSENMHSSYVRRLSGLANWAFDFEYEVQIGGDWSNYGQVLSVVSPEGAGYLFGRDSNGNMNAYNDGADVIPQTDYKLSFVGNWPSTLGALNAAPSNWILTDRQDRTWYLQSFKDPATQTYLIAKPFRMVEPGGRELKFTYGASAELLAIADSDGNKITFDWIGANGPSAIGAAHLPGGATIQYVYDTLLAGDTSPDRLIRVEHHDGTGTLVDKTTYVYGDTRFPMFVTQIKDKNDVVRWSVTYNGDGRATSSAGPGGTDQYTVDYGPIGPTFTRTVTNPFGKVSTYNYVDSGGYGITLSSVTTAATATTPATTTSIAKAADYSIAGVTDPESRTTAYTRDAAGHPTQIIEAQATAQARTANVTWLAGGNRPTQIVAPGLTTTISYTTGTSAVAVDGVTPPPITAHRFWRVRSSTTGTGGYLGIAELQMRTNAAGSNLTSGKTAAASAVLSGYPASNAVNGNAADFWTTGNAAPPGGGHWLSVDLQSAATVSEVTITARPDNYREDPLNLYVDSSDDNANWTNQWLIATIPAWSAGQTRTFDNPATVPPVFTAQPTVCGSPLVGSTLAGAAGSHNGTSATYRWLNNGAAISGATSLNYVVASSDSGGSLSFEVTATNASGSTVATTPTFTGGVDAHCSWRVRSSTTAETGYLGIAELQLRATAGGSNLATGGTAAASFALSGYPAANAINGNPADFWTTGGTAPPSGGHWLSVSVGRPVTVNEAVITVRPDQYREDPLNLFVDSSDDNSTWTTQWSIASIPSWTAGQTRALDNPNAVPPVFVAQPSVCGSPVVGGTLVGTSGAPSGAAASYRWLSNGVAIPGATGLNYVVASGDSGQSLSFEVTATNSAGSTVAASPTFTAGADGHCYWRVRSSTTAESGNFAIAELELRATVGGPDLTTGKPAAASAALSGYPPSNAINDNTADFWTSAPTTPPAGGHWLSVGFGRPVPIKEAVITVRPDQYREDPLNLFVDASDDNSAWTNAWSVTTIPAWSAGQTRTFDSP